MTVEHRRLVEYTIDLHRLLRQKAKKAKGTGDYIYEGKLGETYDELRISRSYYSRILEVLQEVGSVEFLIRGTRHYPTRIRVLEEPSPEMIEGYEDLTREPGSRRVTGSSLAQRITAIERRTGTIDVVEALKQMEQRLTVLEARKGQGTS